MLLQKKRFTTLDNVLSDEDFPSSACLCDVDGTSQLSQVCDIKGICLSHLVLPSIYNSKLSLSFRSCRHECIQTERRKDTCMAS